VVSETSTETLPDDAPAPGELEFVRELVNTRELDPDREDLGDPDALGAWLGQHGIPVGGPLAEPDVKRAQAFREAIRALLLANNGETLPGASLEELREAARSAPLQIEVGGDGSLATAPATSGVDALIARTLAVAAAAQERGEWERLKACRSHECVWVFYDRSRNHSRHWCSMGVCGNRAKTRTYRAKRKPQQR
jgi:predicted RNA-binding Zn ribbon-like protein